MGIQLSPAVNVWGSRVSSCCPFSFLIINGSYCPGCPSTELLPKQLKFLLQKLDPGFTVQLGSFGRDLGLGSLVGLGLASGLELSQGGDPEGSTFGNSLGCLFSVIHPLFRVL